MLAGKGSQVFFPNGLAVVRQSHQGVMRWGSPADIDPVLINRRGCGGKRVVVVLVVKRSGNDFCHSTCPVSALTQKADTCLVWSSPVVKKTLLPHSTGEEWPAPGKGSFQLMSFSVQVVGMVLAGLTPLPLGPRNRVHS